MLMITQIGNEYYRQVIGIPQGSILSSLLCSFFYGDLERNHLRFTDDPSSVSDLPVNIRSCSFPGVS